MDLRRTTILLFHMSLCLLYSSLQAQDILPLATNRPSFSATTYTLQPGNIQFEGGYQREHISGEITHTLPVTEVHLGLREGTEGSLIWSGMQLRDRTSAFSDITLTVKQRLIGMPSYHVSLQGLLTLPTGNRWATRNRLTPAVALIWDYSFTPSFTTFGTAILIGSETPGADAALGLAFPLASQFSAFVEYYVQMSGDATYHTADAGLLLLLSPDVQLDLNGGINLTHTGHFYAGVGIAYRIRKAK